MSWLLWDIIAQSNLFAYMEKLSENVQLQKSGKVIIAFITIIIMDVAIISLGIQSDIATLLILGLTCIQFLVDWMPVVYVAIMTPLQLYLCGCIDLKTTFSGFSNENVILFIGMFIIGGAIFKTGAAEVIGKQVIAWTHGDINKIIISILVLTALFSAFMSNTGCVAVITPICIGIADAAGIERKRILLPVAMISSLGGMMTLVGTPPNLTINSIYNDSGCGQFGFFEFSYIGLPLTIVGGLYLYFFYAKKEGIDGFSDYCIDAPKLDKKQLFSIAILLIVVSLMASGRMELSIVSSIAALFCIACKLISSKDALESIGWRTVLLFTGMLPMSTALSQTGAGKLIADFSLKIMGGNPSQVISITVLFVITVLLTQAMSNTAACALLAPIALQIASSLNANPAGVLMSVGIASSCAFMTPMATPPNTLVYEESGAKFVDYITLGSPLVLLGYLVCIIVIPIVWPFY